MQKPKDAARGSYAYAHRGELPGQKSTLDRAQNAAPAFDHSSPVQGPQRASAMVGRDRPEPAPRPSPALSLGPDRAAFNAAWEREAREARRAAFKAKRAQEQATGRGRKRSRQVAH